LVILITMATTGLSGILISGILQGRAKLKTDKGLTKLKIHIEVFVVANNV
jgi:hypothetical protein